MKTEELDLLVGIDDTDSKQGMCTTYLGAVVLQGLLDIGLRQAGYPSLVRLNPNCPHKTRGNAAVALHLTSSRDKLSEAREFVLKTVEGLYEKGHPDTQPGIVFLPARKPPEPLQRFSEEAVRQMVTLEEAMRLAERCGAETYGLNGGRGIIGSLAAVGAPLQSFTYEAVAYRRRENWGTVRRLDPESVVEMDLEMGGETFDNLDHSTGEARVAPHTPCPVLAGVRGRTAEAALRGLRMLRFHEEVERVVVFRTNQATDMHLTDTNVAQLHPYSNAIITGVVSSYPYTIRGGHVFVSVRDETGEIVCAAYQPTLGFREVVRRLLPGDVVRVMGGVKPKPEGLTLNLEKLEILQLAEHYVVKSPTCVNCRRTMESEGRKGGYRCRVCGSRMPRDASRIRLNRNVASGLYQVPTAARRHLSKSLELILS